MENKKKSGSSFFVALMAKGAKLVKAVKAFKFIKPMITLISMALSMAAYSGKLGWTFGIGLVVMIFIHEMGHVFALKRKGFAASAPVFIPFLGAAIFAPKMGNRDDEAYIGYGGPLVGGLAALVLFLIVTTLKTPPPALVMVSFTAAFINLFNMIPIRPLDGGRVTQAIGEWFKYVGLALLVGFTALMRDPGLLLIWILVLDDLSLSPPITYGLGRLCLVAMVIMFIFHIGVDEPRFAMFVDVVLASLFTLGFSNKAKKYKQTMLRGETWEEEDTDPRPVLSKAVRNQWLLRYAVLAVGLYGLMQANIPYLTSVAHR